MVIGRPAGPGKEEFSTSALQYVSGLVLAATMAAGHNQSLVRYEFPSRDKITYDKNEGLTRMLREDGRIDEGFSAHLTRTTNIAIPHTIFPEVELNPCAQAPLVQLAKLSNFRRMYVLNIFNHNAGPDSYKFLDVGCFIYGNTGNDELIYSMQISPVHFQSKRENVTHILPTNLVFRIDTKHNRLYATAPKIIGGKPIGLRGASITVSRKYPEATVYRLTEQADQVLAYQARTTWKR